MFDLLQIALYHGWLVDPQDEELVKAIDGSSYNQLVEKIITSKDGEWIKRTDTIYILLSFSI